MAAVDAQLVSRSDAWCIVHAGFRNTAHDPAISKAIPRASGEWRPVTRMPPLDVLGFFARRGDGDRAGELFSSSIPSTMRYSAAFTGTIRPYVASPMLLRGRSTSAGRLDLVHGFCGMMYRTAVEGILAFVCWASMLPSIPAFAHRRALSHVQTRIVALPHRWWRNPRGVSQGVIHASLDGGHISLAL